MCLVWFGRLRCVAAARLGGAFLLGLAPVLCACRSGAVTCERT